MAQTVHCVLLYDKLLQEIGRQLNELLQSVSSVMDSVDINELIKTGRQYQVRHVFKLQIVIVTQYINTIHSVTHTDTHTRTHTHTHACTHARTHTCTHARTNAHTHARTHAPMHARTHTHTCTHARTHTHTSSSLLCTHLAQSKGVGLDPGSSLGYCFKGQKLSKGVDCGGLLTDTMDDISCYSVWERKPNSES